MKTNPIVIVVLLGLHIAIPAFAESTPRFAQVSMQQIYNTLGHQSLLILNVSKETRDQIQGLKQKIDDALLELLQEEDVEKIAVLESAISTNNKKLKTFQNSLSQRRMNDYRAVLRSYIRANYSTEYDLIIDADSSRGNQYFVHTGITIPDITDKVILSLKKEVP